MTVNRLVFCKDCLSRESWERFPDRDIPYESEGIFEYCYRCRICGKLTWYPIEPELTVTKVPVKLTGDGDKTFSGR